MAHKPHALLSVTEQDVPPGQLKIRCMCRRWQVIDTKEEAERKYEAHVVQVGATLGKVPWRKDPE